MGKITALKTLFRSPAKTVLTFFLIAAASFALFSRVTDYAVTRREAAKAESFYSGVAALDNDSPPMTVKLEIDGVEWTSGYSEMKPWPDAGQIEEFISLPGVTLADTRYMTAGRIGNYRRLTDETQTYTYDDFILEGVYSGYEELDGTGRINLLFNDVTVHAGNVEISHGEPLKIAAIVAEELVDEKNPYPRAFFKKLKTGSRCLVMGSNISGELSLENTGQPREKALRVVEGLGDHYLETEDFAFYKEQIDLYHENLYVYDIVYTKDMRSIPRFNERNMFISKGRPLMDGDTDVCVINEAFLDEYGLSVGDRIRIELGDELMPQSGIDGATLIRYTGMPNYVSTAEVEIVGAYRLMDAYSTRLSENSWSYTPSTVFVPPELLPVEIPQDYEPFCGEFSVLIENVRDIEAFREAAEPLAVKMGMGLRFSDGGWSSMKGSFETGQVVSILSIILYVAGAALALFLAAYLYIGRNKTSYAIMRTLGVSGKTAGNLTAFPFVILSVFAMPVGGIAGLLYASYKIAETLAGMSDSSAPDGYVFVLNAELPAGVIVLCMVLEFIFISSVTVFFLRKMKKTPPLELLQEGTQRTGNDRKADSVITEEPSVPSGFNIAMITDADDVPAGRKYGALSWTTHYIFRQLGRGIGKTAVSFILSGVLAAGTCMFVLARLAYQDAFREVEVKGKALEFASFSIDNLSSSDLIRDFYCYSNFSVRTNNIESHSSMIVTNDVERYLTEDYNITYAEGYDRSVLDKSGQVCLVGQTLADMLGIRPGDEIGLLSDNMYYAIKQICKDKDEKVIEEKVESNTRMYKVAGIVASGNENVSAGIITGINSGAQDVYGQPFPFGYSEFTLTDNVKLSELNSMMEQEQKESQKEYSPMASFHVDSESLSNIIRIRDLLVALFPIAVAAAILIGMFGSGMVIIQSAQEAAFLRVLGVTKKRVRCILVFRQMILCAVGICIVAGVLYLLFPDMSVRSARTLAACLSLYFVGSMFGSAAAAVHVTRRRVLELLQVRE